MKSVRYYPSISALVAAFMLVCMNAAAIPPGTKVVPNKYNNIPGLYVFGPEAKRSNGREDGMQVIFYRVPKRETGDVTIWVRDPGIGGATDRSRERESTPTMTLFSVYGGAGAFTDALSKDPIPLGTHPGNKLSTASFHDEHPDEWIKLGTYKPAQGETVGNYVYFKLVVEATQGRLGNSFKTAISPKASRAFTYNATIRLNETSDAVMNFVVEVPEHVSKIYAYTYDLDAGGRGAIVTEYDRHKIRPSRTGKWRKSKIKIGYSDVARMVTYEIRKGSQTYANCGYRFTDDLGNPLKTFFSPDVMPAAPAPAPKPKAAVQPKVTRTYNECEYSTGTLHFHKQVPEEVSLGEEYAMNVTVTGLVDAANVTINDMLPEGAAYVSSDPAGQHSGRQLSWTIDRLAKGESRTLVAKLRAQKEGDLLSCATFAAIPIGCVTTLIGNPKLAVEKTGPESAIVDSTVPYAITVSNIGSAVAKNVVLTDTVPNGLVHDSKKSTVTYNVGNLQPSESRSVNIALRAGSPGTFCNKVVASSSNAPSVNDDACTKILKPMLAVEKTGPKKQYFEKNAAYKIQVSNPGDVDLTDVKVSDRAPAATSIVSAPGAALAGQTATWTIPTLKAGGRQSFDVVLTSRTGGTHCNEVNVRSTRGLTADSSACTLWEGYPAILLEVIDTIDPLQIGEHTTYVIKVTNQGTAEDTNVGITARFPAEITPKSVSGATAGRIDGKSVTFTPYKRLNAKEMIEFRIDAEAAKIGDSRLKVSLTSDLLKTPVPEEESTHVY